MGPRGKTGRPLLCIINKEYLHPHWTDRGYGGKKNSFLQTQSKSNAGLVFFTQKKALSLW